MPEEPRRLINQNWGLPGNTGWLKKNPKRLHKTPPGIFRVFLVLAAELCGNFSESSFSLGAELLGFFLATELLIFRFGFFF